MRSRNPERMKRIQTYAERYYREKHTAPSIRAIAEGTGLPRATVQRYLVEMNGQGLLSYDGRIQASPLMDKCRTAYISLPLLGSIRCGGPESEEPEVEEYVSLPVSIFGNEADYLLRAKGDSMLDAGIAEGDLLVVRAQSEARVGDIVVALDPDGQNTLKQYAGYDADSGYYILEYRNNRRYPGQTIRVRSFVVQGVVRHVIKSF